MSAKGGNKKSAPAKTSADKQKIQKVREKIHLKSEVDFRIWFLVLLLCFVIASSLIFYFWKKTLKEMAWKPIVLEKPKTYETVLLSMVNGIVKSSNDRTFLIEASGKEIQFYINANTRLFNGAGEKLSEESGFSFSDYLKNGQKVKILYAPYDKIFIASEIWLTE